MDLDSETLGKIRAAVQVKSHIEDGDGLRKSAVVAALGISTVVRDVADDAAGASWLGVDAKSHSLLATGNQLIHVIVAGDAVLEATNYSAAIDTLRAEEVHQLGRFVDEGCRVMRWHVTLRDGSVISLRAANGQHADELAKFVRAHLIPPGAP